MYYPSGIQSRSMSLFPCLCPLLLLLVDNPDSCQMSVLFYFWCYSTNSAPKEKNKQKNNPSHNTQTPILELNANILHLTMFVINSYLSRTVLCVFCYNRIIVIVYASNQWKLLFCCMEIEYEFPFFYRSRCAFIVFELFFPPW